MTCFSARSETEPLRKTPTLSGATNAHLDLLLILETRNWYVLIAVRCHVPNAYYRGKQLTRDCHAKTLQLGKKPTTPIIKPKGWKNICKNMESSVRVANSDTP